MEELEQRRMKKDIRYACRVMLVSFAVMFAAEVLLSDVFFEIFYWQHPAASWDELLDMVYESGTLMILVEGAAALAACALLLRVRRLDLFEEKRPASFTQMAIFFFCLMGLQLLASFCIYAMEGALNLTGWSLLDASEAASGGSVTPSMLAYSVLFAPVLEELIFRGAIQHYLMPYGKRFAILLAALLFGLMHSNIAQLPVAMLVGLLLGYIAAEYSLPAAMVIHSLCNVSVEMSSLLYDRGWYLAAAIDGMAVYVGLAVLLAVVVKYRREIAQYARENKGAPGSAKAVLTSVSFWVMTAAMVVLTAWSLTPL